MKDSFDVMSYEGIHRYIFVYKHGIEVYFYSYINSFNIDCLYVKFYHGNNRVSAVSMNINY